MRVTYHGRSLRRLGFIKSLDSLKSVLKDFQPIIITSRHYDNHDVILLKDDATYREQRNAYDEMLKKLDKLNADFRRFYTAYSERSSENVEWMFGNGPRELGVECGFDAPKDTNVKTYINSVLCAMQKQVEDAWKKLKLAREKFLDNIAAQIQAIDVHQLENRCIILDIDDSILSDIMIVVGGMDDELSSSTPCDRGVRITSSIVDASLREGYYINARRPDRSNITLENYELFTDLNYLKLLQMNGVSSGPVRYGTGEPKMNIIERQIVQLLLRVSRFDLLLKFEHYPKQPVAAETMVPSLCPYLECTYKYPNCYLYYIIKHFFPYCCSTSVVTEETLSVI